MYAERQQFLQKLRHFESTQLRRKRQAQNYTELSKNVKEQNQQRKTLTALEKGLTA